MSDLEKKYQKIKEKVKKQGGDNKNDPNFINYLIFGEISSLKSLVSYLAGGFAVVVVLLGIILVIVV